VVVEQFLNPHQYAIFVGILERVAGDMVRTTWQPQIRAAGEERGDLRASHLFDEGGESRFAVRWP
jgi:hypothetical protein